ncbi:MAG: biopolymer transporter ExbD [Treponema sp.]|jgi:biopolymer transport protein ExbD|nr:biopolymer transporter ExbD [Treponema sp.]
MKIKRRGRHFFSDSSASSDVAFLLIIYFMVIAGFNINRGFLMNLPARNSTRLILKDDLLRLDMNERGEISFEGTILSRAEAEAEIGGLAFLRPNFAVVLSVDPRAPWQEVVSFVEMVQRLNVNSFSFSMKGSGA